MRLINYRNYEDASPIFTPGFNIIYGDNGQGKTNLLESIFLLLRGYSHRASSTKELIKFGEKTMFAALEFRDQDTTHNVSLKAENGKKGWKLDSKSESSFSKIQKLTGCILFEPNDLEIVKGGPDNRRRFINMELSGLIPPYKGYYRQFERVRLQRNALLKQAKLNNTPFDELRNSLRPWDNQLVQNAAKIYNLRNRYLKQLTNKSEKFYRGLVSPDEKLGLKYVTNIFDSEIPKDVNEISSVYKQVLESELENDLERGFTRKGPHSDDLEILVNDQNARLFASQGQQRTAAISLKLAHIDLYKENLNFLPVVLLDDILSELDINRQRNILSVLEGTQTFITCTNPSFSSHLKNEVNKIHISDGVIK